MTAACLVLMVGFSQANFLQLAAPAAGDDAPARPKGYRNAWDDCGGAGASATERMRSIAASIKGFAKDVPFKRSAAQDCGKVDSAGLKPGPGTEVVYPNPGVLQAATQGLMTASLAKDESRGACKEATCGLHES